MTKFFKHKKWNICNLFPSKALSSIGQLHAHSGKEQRALQHVADLQTKLAQFTFIFPDKGRIRAENMKAKLSICHCVFILLFADLCFAHNLPFFYSSPPLCHHQSPLPPVLKVP